MKSIKNICEILFFGLIDYVPQKKLIEYQNEFSKRKVFTSKFALSFFPKYIDFGKAVKNPFSNYDVLLLNYWLIEVPTNGIKWSKLISDYHYGRSGIVNKREKAKNKRKSDKPILLLTKKQREEIKKAKLKN